MSTKRSTILLIHGLWGTPMIWEPFFKFYGNLGYPVLAPTWLEEGSIADLRRDPSGLSAISLPELLARHAKIVHSLSDPPVIIGHCYGGLIAQLLGDQGLGAAVVAIAPIPPNGFLLRSIFTSLTLLSALADASRDHDTCRLTFGQFRSKFCNTLPESNARQIYDAQVIPAPRRLVLQAGLASFTPGAATAVDFGNPRRPPLLVIGGGADALVSARLCRALSRRHRASSRLSAYKEFPGRSHLVIAEPGWQEVADYALTWALTHARA